MTSIKEIISIIYATECKKYLLEGYLLSDPIVSKDATGIIDNFFIYEESDDSAEVAGPIVIFGIYSEQKKVAYIRENKNFENLKIKSNSVDIISDDNFYSQYEKDFLQIRDWVMLDIDGEKKIILRRYLESLNKIFGIGVVEICREAVPTFFEWADNFK